MTTHPKRPRDPNQLAKSIIDIRGAADAPHGARDFRDWLFAGLRKATDEEGIYTSLGAGAASALPIFDLGRDPVCGSHRVHCCMDLRGPSNGRVIR
jgi:hypothetical protein